MIDAVTPARVERNESAGFLLVHFVEDPEGFGERVFFSLSGEDDPTTWTRLNTSRPVLESTLGTTGVRDPFIVRGKEEFYIIGTDLRVHGGDAGGWDAWRRQGSRSIVVWRSDDLIHWSPPWTLELAPPDAGMAWAPEAIYDPAKDAFLVFWSSTLFGVDDRQHDGDTYSRILGGWTSDFRSVREVRTMIDYGVDVIDTTIHVHEGMVHRISKEDSNRPDSRRVFHEIGSDYFADDFTLVQARIADSAYRQVEGPLMFLHDRKRRWYLFVDQFDTRPQGYVALTTTDLAAGWTLLPTDDFRMPTNTKHGSVIPIDCRQRDALLAAYPPSPDPA